MIGVAFKPDDGTKRLTDDEIDRIVELRLNRMSVRETAAAVGCSPQTVTLHWHRWLDQTSTERREELERMRSEVIARLDSNAAQLRRGAIRARGDVRTQPDGSTVVVVEPNQAIERSMLDAERRALVALARTAGYEAPKVLQLNPAVTQTEEEAAAIIAEFENSDDDG